MKRGFWLAVAIAMASYALLIFWVAPVLYHRSGGLPVFDIRISAYSAEDAMAYVEALGETGRQFYLTRVRPLDTLFPIAFCLALVLGYGRWLPGKNSGVRAALILVAVVYLVCDLWENANIATMLENPAKIDPALVKQTHLVTLAKWFYALLALFAWLWLAFKQIGKSR
ncbi:MAG: hypothetical protein KDJ67_11330 [Nitratireductor sp.]|nr:hypothetical protein [Nitratireductor sp.]